MSKLLINEPPLQVLPSLALKIGLNNAIFIQQIYYWHKAMKNSDGWIYNTYVEWQEQFPFWSISTLKRIALDLESRNLIITKMDGNNKKYYKVNLDELKCVENEPDQIDTTSVQDEMTPSQIDTTSTHNDTTSVQSDTSSIYRDYQRLPENNHILLEKHEPPENNEVKRMIEQNKIRSPDLHKEPAAIFEEDRDLVASSMFNGLDNIMGKRSVK